MPDDDPRKVSWETAVKLGAIIRPFVEPEKHPGIVEALFKELDKGRER